MRPSQVRAALALATLLALAGCDAEQRTVTYTLGQPWQGDQGVWFYPREAFSEDRTGLAAIVTRDQPTFTADNERYDPTLLTAAHQTLQLPAIARVTNLENGLQLLVRINDRGPTTPARLIALSPRAAELLEIPADGGTEVRVQVIEADSRRLAAELGGGPAPATAAPVDAVASAELPPPPGVEASGRGRHAAAGPAVPAAEMSAAASLPTSLPEDLTRVATRPGRLFIDAGTFDGGEFAGTRMQKLWFLPVHTDRIRIGRQTSYHVIAGPFRSVAAADAALDRALAAGVPDARIVVME